jgi:hypothetical protein
MIKDTTVTDATTNYKMSIDAPPLAVAAVDTAEIDVTVKAFHGVNNRHDGEKLCEVQSIVIKDDAGGRVFQLAGDPTLRIRRGAAAGSAAKKIKLIFTILPANTYIVAGVCFSSDGFNGHGNMKNNFEIVDGNDHKLTIIDKYSRGLTFWDVLIAVQEKLTGLIGIIDPGVENTEQD